jgi:hypothetical protein
MYQRLLSSVVKVSTKDAPVFGRLELSCAAAEHATSIEVTANDHLRIVLSRVTD